MVVVSGIFGEFWPFRCRRDSNPGQSPSTFSGPSLERFDRIQNFPRIYHNFRFIIAMELSFSAFDSRCNSTYVFSCSFWLKDPLLDPCVRSQFVYFAAFCSFVVKASGIILRRIFEYSKDQFQLVFDYQVTLDRKRRTFCTLITYSLVCGPFAS